MKIEELEYKGIYRHVSHAAHSGRAVSSFTSFQHFGELYVSQSFECSYFTIKGSATSWSMSIIELSPSYPSRTPRNKIAIKDLHHTLITIILLLFSLLHAQEKPDSINPRVVQFTQQNIDFHNFYSDSFKFNPSELIFWDNADIMLYDYVRSLGQVGKPHEVYQNSLPIRYNNDPFLQQNQVYFWDIEKQSLFLNTRTSFIRAKFNQSGFKTQNLGLILSRNINPFWNVTIKSQRRTSVGAYLNNVTDHWNIHLTTHFLSRNQRHFLGLATMLHDLKDNLNGGTFQDGSYSYENSFNQNAQPILLRDASWVRKEKSLLSHYSYLLNPDTTKLYFALQAQLGYQWYKWTMRDEQVDSLLLTRSILHNPFGFRIINTLFQEYELEKYFGTMGFIVKINSLRNRLALKVLQNQYKGQLIVQQQRNFQLENLTHFQWSNFYIESRQWVQNSDIFSLSNEHYAKATYQNQDSLKNWNLSFCMDFQNQNPSLRDRYSIFQYFERKQDLKNFQKMSFFLETGLDKKSWQIEGKFFYHQIFGAIYFNSQTKLVQNSNMWINFGNDIKARYQWKSYFINVQYTGFINSQNVLGLSDRLPKHIVSMNLLYNKLHFKNQIELNFELKNKWFSKTQAYLFDHSGFFWYPYLDVTQKAVLVSDIYGSAKFKKAVIFIRFNNLWDGILYPGYYTSYYHPMVNRSLNFGVAWDFTD